MFFFDFLLLLEGATQIYTKSASPADFLGRLATVEDTAVVTAVLEAGRRSLDEGNRRVEIIYGANGQVSGLK